MNHPQHHVSMWRGSNVYEVNMWLWQFGRGKPSLGGLGWILPAKRQTSVGRRLVKAARVMVPEMKCELDLYEYVLVQT